MGFNLAFKGLTFAGDTVMTKYELPKAVNIYAGNT
jgi:hypothetical protein